MEMSTTSGQARSTMSGETNFASAKSDKTGSAIIITLN